MKPDFLKRPGVRAGLVAAVVVTILSALLIVRVVTSSGSTARGAFPGVSEKLAAAMQLTGLPQQDYAPVFSLVDQNGRLVTLSDLRGRIVVITFMDPHCTDICPLVSEEFTDAYHDLGPLAVRVVFVAINVNPFHNRVADVAAFSRDHGLDAIPNWHFVTGSQAHLMSNIWQEYGVTVQAANPQADVIHTSVIYFIDANGAEVYAASPTDMKTARGTGYLPAGQLTDWGHGIADVARYMATH